MSFNQIDFKCRLHQHCINILKNRIIGIEEAMDAAQIAANSEEKSSAGDKYETSRAMSHREKDMQGRQLVSNQSELAALAAIDCNKINTLINAGSLVSCNKIQFFIVAGLGKITFEDQLIYLVSPQAPIAKNLIGKQVGDEIVFNNTSIVITEIF